MPVSPRTWGWCIGKSDIQRAAADIAADGAGDLRAAHRKALEAIAEAEADGREQLAILLVGSGRTMVVGPVWEYLGAGH
jgi:hypothetical protein